MESQNNSINNLDKTITEKWNLKFTYTIVTKLEIPTYFVMGKYDYMTSSNAAKNFFDKIEANQKEFISFEQSAHFPLFEEKEKFYKWMADTFIN